MDFGLKDKAVLVTGGNRGIGLPLRWPLPEKARM